MVCTALCDWGWYGIPLGGEVSLTRTVHAQCWEHCLAHRKQLLYMLTVIFVAVFWTNPKFLKIRSHFGTIHLGEKSREIVTGLPTPCADSLLCFPRNPGLCGLQSPEKLQVLLREHPQSRWVRCIPLHFLQGLWVCKLLSRPESQLGSSVPSP